MEYLNRFRLDCACADLRSGRMSINQIAFTHGFKDPGYFTKLFNRCYQMPPSAYRRKYQPAEAA